MLNLEAVDKVEITVIMDNYADWILLDTPYVKRAIGAKDGRELKVPLMAEHSLCLLIRIYKDNVKYDILLDTAENGVSLKNNIDILGLNLKTVKSLVISHAHSDHTHGLSWVISQLDENAQVIAHPDVFLSGRTFVENGVSIINDCLERKTILSHGNSIIDSLNPYSPNNKLFAVTGEIPRTTDFEKLEYESYLTRNGVKEFDNILDDQAIVINIKDKGLLIISGCAHAGIINTIKYAQAITAIDKIHGVIGGFHLPPNIDSKVTKKTIEALKQMNPNIVVPMHCTGIYAISQFINEFKDKCNLSCVGSTFIF
ncbi:MAG: MBL fold metallo-hydrolase [Sphaerochaetaceae bacterium]|nr:MBL fold metallo-hydrolase [Sphaerochaetaceae bacterium]